MSSAVAADKVGLQQNDTFGIRFYALGFKNLRPKDPVDFSRLQQDMRRVFAEGK